MTGNTLTVAGTDGQFIYATDYCGLRRIDPNTGATTTVNSMRWNQITITGTTAYGIYWNVLYSINLAAGGTLTSLGAPGVNGTLAADPNAIWISTGSNLYRYDLGTKTTTLTAGSLPLPNTPTTLLSIGDYLYANTGSTNNYATLLRINKTDGSSIQITTPAGDGLGFTNISGLASDGTQLFVADTTNTTGSIDKLTPWNHEDVFSGWLFIPDNNVVPSDLTIAQVGAVQVTQQGWTGKVLLWDHQTHRCLSNCNEINALGDMMYYQDGSNNWVRPFWCTTSAGCTSRDDYVARLIEQIVDEQGEFNQDGTLNAEYVAVNLLGTCFELVAHPSTDCVEADVRYAASQTHSYEQMAEDAAAFIAGRPGRLRANLNDEQAKAKARYEELAKQACEDTPRQQNQSPQEWGMEVHKRFEELVRAHGDPKMMGETGYLGGGVLRPSQGRPSGSSFPDAVYGADPDHPEMAFDLKTGLKLIAKWWVERLSTNLPSADVDIPVFDLTC